MAKRKRRTFTPEFKTEVVLEALRGVPKQNCVADTTSAKINSLSGSSSLLKMLSVSLLPRISNRARMPSVSLTLNASLGGWRSPWTCKKSIDLFGLIPAKQCQIVEVLGMKHSVRDICGVLGITRSSLYYHPKLDPYEEELRTRIEHLAAAYPTYG